MYFACLFWCLILLMSQVREFFQNSAVQLQALSEFRINLVSSIRTVPTDLIAQRALDLLTRHVRVFGKLFRRIQRDHTANFVTLPMCGDLVLYYWSKVVQATTGPPEQIADSSLVTFPVRFLVQGMALFRDSLAQWAPTKRDGSPNERGVCAGATFLLTWGLTSL